MIGRKEKIGETKTSEIDLPYVRSCFVGFYVQPDGASGFTVNTVSLYFRNL